MPNDSRYADEYIPLTVHARISYAKGSSKCRALAIRSLAGHRKVMGAGAIGSYSAEIGAEDKFVPLVGSVSDPESFADPIDALRRILDENHSLAVKAKLTPMQASCLSRAREALEDFKAAAKGETKHTIPRYPAKPMPVFADQSDGEVTARQNAQVRQAMGKFHDDLAKRRHAVVAAMECLDKIDEVFGHE